MHLSVRTYVFLLAAAPTLFAQTRLTLAEAVSEALASHPQLAAAAARAAATVGLRRQAGLSPNPRLIFQSETSGFPAIPPSGPQHDRDTYAFLAQTVETGGKRNRRVALAAENVRRSELEVQLYRRQITSRVSTAYWAAAGAARVEDLLRMEVASFDQVVQFHRDRVREGAAPEVDLLRIEVERDRLESAAKTAVQDAERTRIAVFREMGKTEFPAVEFGEALDQAHPVAYLTLGQVLDQRAEMKLAREAVEQARADLRLQEANGRPDPDVHLGYKRTEEFDSVYAAVQIPLPVRNRNQGLVEAAAAEVKAAESSVAATEALVRAELESAKRDYESRQKLLDETLRPMRDRAGEVYRIVDAAYRETGSDILRLLDAERTRIEADLMFARTLSELQQSAVALETAQGSLP
ncbi:MAG TPA: TolC family protein [Bryobacteraceae bacterium]|nr:TolC family protein [Bryobacteraceae bacterium]